jgi:hypothetical protein
LENNTKIPANEELITRKEAIVRVGKYAAFTAASMMLILAPFEGNAARKKSPKPPRVPVGKKQG